MIESGYDIADLIHPEWHSSGYLASIIASVRSALKEASSPRILVSR